VAQSDVSCLATGSKAKGFLLIIAARFWRASSASDKCGVNVTMQSELEAIEHHLCEGLHRFLFACRSCWSWIGKQFEEIDLVADGGG
jgi:hypothetical protein